jgi:rhodanese-related sulfurtransferase
MSVKNITVREAHQKQTEGYTYVDVRSVLEYEQGHPAGAVNIPLLDHDARTGQMIPNRDFLEVIQANFPADAKLLVGCQVGGRSAQAAQILSGSGYVDVTNVLGGYGGARDQFTGTVRAEGWAQAGLPVESGQPSGRSYNDMRTRTKGGARR